MEAISKGQEGKAAKAFRTFRQYTQEYVALSLDCTQQAVSDMERRAYLDTETKDILSKLFEVPVEAFENYSEDKAVNIFANNFTNTNHDQAAFFQTNHNPVYHPTDKVTELYERIIREKDDKIAELQAELQKVLASKSASKK